MKNLIATAGTTLAIFLFAVCLSTHAEVHLPAIFSDGMVMQQQTHANLWGTATPNKKVTVRTSWDGKLYAATAGCIGFMMIKYEWGIGKKHWFKAFPFAIVAINILIAVASLSLIHI